MAKVLLANNSTSSFILIPRKLNHHKHLPESLSHQSFTVYYSEPPLSPPNPFPPSPRRFPSVHTLGVGHNGKSESLQIKFVN